MNYPDYSRTCELGIRRLTNARAITFSQRASMIDACLAAHSFEELEPWIQNLLRPDFEAMEQALSDPTTKKRSIPAVGRSDRKPSKFMDLLGGSLTRQPHSTQIGPDGRFSLCSQPHAPGEPAPSGQPDSTPPPSTKALNDGLETKAAPGLRIEPYDPDAIDGDGDGIVQEGTAWERPAGTRLLDAAGKAIERGLTSAMRPQGLRVVDTDGNDVQYRPRYGEGLPEQEIRTPEKPKSKLGELGFQSLREQGHSPIIDLMAPEPPKPEEPPKPVKTPAAPKAPTELAAIEPIPALPWTVGIDGVDNPEIHTDRDRTAFDRLDSIQMAIYNMLTNPGRMLLIHHHGNAADEHDLTPEQEAQLAQLEAFLERIGADLGEGDEALKTFEKLLLSDIAEFFADAGQGEMLVNTSAADAIRVFEDGRYWSQFVTNKSSSGNVDFEHRRHIEERFGVPADAPDELRPIYGHVGLPGDDTPYAEREAARTYGEVTFILKPDVVDRATFSVGDSYNARFGVSLADTDIADVDWANLDMMDPDGANGAQLLASAVDKDLFGWFAVRTFRDQMRLAGADEASIDLATRMLARRYGLIEYADADYDPDKFPTGPFYYVEHQLHGGFSLDDVAAIHLTPNESPSPLRLKLLDETQLAAIAAENAGKDRIRKIAKERGILVIEDPLARPDTTRARVGEVASAQVLEALGGTPGGPLPYTPGHPPEGHRIPERLGLSLNSLSARRSNLWYQRVMDTVAQIVGDDDALDFDIRRHLSTDDAERHLVETLERFRLAPTLLSTDADSVLGFFADETYLPASGIDGLEGLGAHRAQYELEGLGVPLDLPVERRPVYGHIDTRLEGDDVRALPGADYGPIHIVLKNTLKDRTTFTIGDSLIGETVALPAYEPVTVGTVARSLDDETYLRLVDDEIARAVRTQLDTIEGFYKYEPGGPDAKARERIAKLQGWLDTRGVTTAPDGTIKAPRLFDTTYLEAQIHDGVSIDDVAEIILPAGDDPQLQAIRSAAKERGIRIVEEAAARRFSSPEELATKALHDALAALSDGSFGTAPTDPKELPKFVASTYSSAELDNYIGYANGELILLEDQFATDIVDARDTLGELIGNLEISGGAGFGPTSWAKLHRAAGQVLAEDAIRARIRTRILERERRVAEGRPLEVDYERIRGEVPNLPDPAEWPPAPDALGYLPDGSASPIDTTQRAQRAQSQAGVIAQRIINIAEGDLAFSGDVTLPDGTTMSYADVLRLAFLGIDASGTSSDDVRRALSDALDDPGPTLKQAMGRLVLDRATELIKRDVDHVREGRPVINVMDDVVAELLGLGHEPGGRYWSQFVTGTSNGLLDAGWRIEAETQLAGVPDDILPEHRPVYGHIIHDVSDVDRAEQYGTWALVLRPETVDSRTTITIDDSLQARHLDEDGQARLGALSLLEPSGETSEDLLKFVPPGFVDFGRADRNGEPFLEDKLQYYLDEAMVEKIREKLDELGIYQLADWPQDILDRLSRRSSPMPDPRKGWESYLEAQIHGGVSLHDVESIYISQAEWASLDPVLRGQLMRRAEEYGIDILHDIALRS